MTDVAEIAGLFCGFKVIAHEPGTVITDRRTGRQFTVTDNSIIFCDAAHVTPKTYDAIRTHLENSREP
ncbi:MAG: hypothetical protein ACOY7T_08210 [Pseudomonadota bacterium]